MIKSTLSISQVKEIIQNMKEKSVKVTLNVGRNKFTSYKGKLSGIYPALFTVTPFDESYKGKISYSYSEYMCGRVKLNEIKNTESKSAK